MKDEIIKRFNENVKGKIPNLDNANTRHDGREGHWLETQMGIAHNGDNAADIFGYEMKNGTTSGKTTFGDWSADYYIYKNTDYNITRDDFIKIFGKYNIKKDRYSWSGEPCPKLNTYSNFGQKLFVDDDNNIVATYSYVNDLRDNKNDIIPHDMQQNDLIIAKWNEDSIRPKLERKFNQNGWFKCTKDKNGAYNEIHFGGPINFENWIELVRQGIVFFDSGMYQGNIRPYSQWRAMNTFWNSLITDTH